jgi:multiple sugar transport system substrate-binding protein
MAKKAVTVLILALAATSILWAAGSQEATEGFAGKTIRVLSVSDPYPQRLVELIPEFEAQSGVKVELDLQGYTPAYQKMTLDFLNKVSSYHVVSIDAPWIGEFVLGEKIRPLDDLVSETDAAVLALDDLSGPALEVCYYNETWYALPQGLHGEMLGYRMDLYAEAGLGAPMNDREHLANAEKLTVDTNGDGTIDQYGQAFNGQRGAAFGQQFVEMMYAFGSPVIKDWPNGDMHPVMDTPETRGALQFFIDMKQYAPEDVLNMAWDDRVRSFTQKQSAMTYIWLGRANAVQDPAESQIVGQIAYTPSPGRARRIIPMGGYAWGMPVNIDPDIVGAAWEFMKWDNSVETKKKMVRMMGGAYYDRISVMSDPELQKIQPELKVFLDNLDTITNNARPPIPEISLIFEVLGTTGHEGLSERISVAETTKRIQAEMDEIMKKAGYY